MKLFQKKSNRLSAAEARAIPIDDELIQRELSSIYDLIRSMAKRGKRTVAWSYLTYSKEQQDTISKILSENGYNIEVYSEFYSWLISW